MNNTLSNCSYAGYAWVRVCYNADPKQLNHDGMKYYVNESYYIIENNTPVLQPPRQITIYPNGTIRVPGDLPYAVTGTCPPGLIPSVGLCPPVGVIPTGYPTQKPFGMDSPPSSMMGSNCGTCGCGSGCKNYISVTNTSSETVMTTFTTSVTDFNCV